MKFLRLRKAILWVSVLLVVLIVVFNYLGYQKIEKFQIKNNQFNSAFLIITSALFICFWFIFAFIYAYSQKVNVRHRKWPYIVLIVVLSIRVLASIYFTYKLFAVENIILIFIIKDLKIFSFIILVFLSILLFLMILCLILIKKEKNEINIEYSKSVKATEKTISEAQQKANNQNTNSDDLP